MHNHCNPLEARPEEPCPTLRQRFSIGWIWLVAIVIIIILVLVGSVLHQLYAWTGNNQVVGYFVPNSESVWEHLKLIYWPFLITALILWFFIGHYTSNYLYAVGLAMLIACIFIVVVFYTYTGALGVENVVVDIIIFALAVILGVWLFYFIITQPSMPTWTTLVGLLIIIVLGIVLLAWSYHYPDVPLFQDNA